MSAVKDAEGLAVVVDDTEGEALKQRRLRLGISSRRKFAVIAKEHGFDISLDAIAASDHGRAADETYERIDALLTKLEETAAKHPEVLDDDAAEEEEGGMVEFRLSGNFGVDAVVRGPVANMAELQEAAARLLREMGDRS